MTRNAFRPLVLATLLVLLATASGRASAAASATPSRFQGGETLSLSHLVSTDSSFTSLALVNWSPAETRCTLAFTTSGGTPLGPVLHFSIEPLGSSQLLDALGGWRAERASLKASCDQDFSAYAVVADRQTGAIEPAVLAERTEPISADLLKEDAPLCPAGATCFDAVGVVHVPEPPPGQAVGRVAFPAPTGIAKRLRLTLDVEVGDWFPAQPSGKHLIYWFVVDKNKDMPGMLYFRGPGKDEAFARHGIGITHPEKIKIIKPFSAEVGHTYHIDNDYNMGAKKYTISITDLTTGELKVVLVGKPNVGAYTFKRNAQFLIDMGFPLGGGEPTEVPSFFWKYSNVHIESYKK